MTDPEVIDVFGERAASMDTQPIQYAHPETPPALLIAGSNDMVVGAGNAVRLGRALTAAGANAEAYIYPDLTHVGTVLALAPPFRHRAPILPKMLHFIRHYSRMQA